MTQVLKFKPKDIVVIGRSIGTGPSLDLCTRVEPSMLCLISPFTSIKDVTKNNYGSIASGFLKERFNNREKIKDVKCPVLFVHGKEDSLITYTDSKELYDLCDQPAEILIFKNMTHQHFDVTECVSLPIRKFYEKLYVDWAKQDSSVQIQFPKYLFVCPERDI